MKTRRDDDESHGTLCYGDASKTTAIQPNQYVIILTEASTDWPHNWSLCRVVSIDDQRKTLVNWYGSYAKKHPFTSQMKPGWIDHRDIKKYFQTTCNRHDKKWTSKVDMSQVRIPQEGIPWISCRSSYQQRWCDMHTSNVVIPYKHKAWMVVNDEYVRKFEDTEEATWLVVLNLAKNWETFAGWSKENGCYLFDEHTSGLLGWKNKPTKRSTEQFQCNFCLTCQTQSSQTCFGINSTSLNSSS